MEKFQIVAKTLAGLEEILAKEIETLGGVNIVVGTRMVSFVGDKELLYKANLWLRTALRVLKPVEKFQAADPDELYNCVKQINWSKYVAEGQTIAIDNTIFSEIGALLKLSATLRAKNKKEANENFSVVK